MRYDISMYKHINIKGNFKIFAHLHTYLYILFKLFHASIYDEMRRLNIYTFLSIYQLSVS